MSTTFSGICGHWSFKKQMDGSIGVANGLMSVKLNHVRIELMYVSCDKDIVCASKSLVIFMPSNQLAAPKSVNKYFFFNLFL
jgi:hypothetical protein